jgi:hypothetical protein
VRRFPLLVTPTSCCLLPVDDAEIALVAVELGAQDVVVHLRVLVEDPRGEEEAHGRALDAWAAAGAHGRPPDDPAERRFRGVSVSVADDAGGTYSWRGSTIGGSGRFFEAQWHFAGALPDDASELVVDAVGHAGDRGSVRIAV